MDGKREVRTVKALSDKGAVLYSRFKKFQKISILLYALAAMSFVFASNIPLAIIIVILDIFLEMKVYVCPHCGKTLDCRKKMTEDNTCPGCKKYLFRGL